MLSQGMEREFEVFAARYVDDFIEAAEADERGEKAEYSLKHMDIYHEYLELFERKVSGMCTPLAPSHWLDVET